jgi:hypothetical protein
LKATDNGATGVIEATQSSVIEATHNVVVKATDNSAVDCMVDVEVRPQDGPN